MRKEIVEDGVGCTENIKEKVILWQDHSHPIGYRPTLKMLVSGTGEKMIELNVFGKVSVFTYVSPEPHSEISKLRELLERARERIVHASNIGVGRDQNGTGPNEVWLSDYAALTKGDE